MDLDFSGIDNIKQSEKKAPFTENKKAITELNREIEAVEEAKKIYKEHQEARKQSQCLQWEIMKGVNDGEDIKELFLKAVKTISLMTGTSVFYTQIERQIKEKY